MAGGDLFDSSHTMLKAGEETPVSREEGSVIGSFSEIISGGGVAVRYMGPGGRGVQTVPSTVKAENLELMQFMSVTSLAGEWQDASWWLRKDVFLVSPSDALHTKYTSMKKSWGRVSKEALKQPLFAPKFPGTAGAATSWAALVEWVVEQHNAGKAPGLIACGSREAWLNAPMCVAPSLGMIRAANLDSLKRDSEIKFVLSDLELADETLVDETLGGGGEGDADIEAVVVEEPAQREGGELVCEGTEAVDMPGDAAAARAAAAQAKISHEDGGNHGQYNYLVFSLPELMRQR